MADSPSASPPPRILHALIDTNVVLDIVLFRAPWADQAKPLWDARDSGRVHVYLQASALTDIFYICRKQIGAERAKGAVEDALRRFTIVGMDRVIIEAALTLPGADFEDNVQIACAQSAGLDFIITRDVADYRQSPVPAIAPPDIAKYLAPQP